MIFPKPLSWSEWILWCLRHEPQRFREPPKPVMVKPMELPKAKVTEPTQERFL